MAHILVAEDERDIRELIQYTLTFAGHTLTVVTNGEDAVTQAKRLKPTLIMMDVRMPKMTGYDACRALKQAVDTRDIPVVFLSAKGQDAEVKTGYDAGAIDYVLKPFAPDELTRRINEILAKIGAV